MRRHKRPTSVPCIFCGLPADLRTGKAMVLPLSGKRLHAKCRAQLALELQALPRPASHPLNPADANAIFGGIFEQ
ncbi:MAG TPA: hypothetical protein VFE47_14490 [Tepidisphaeraceae bacterium]|jgi:hypothetical protein|nr:hypothetical protein [Tepidisphaeraceae bacterium]